MMQARLPGGDRSGSVTLLADRAWRRWVENPFAFYCVPLAVGTAVAVAWPGTPWRARVLGLFLSALTVLWFHRWRVLVRADPERRALTHRVLLALVGVALTSALAVIHDAYLLSLLLLLPHFFVELPLGWAIATTVLLTFPTGRLYDTHGQIPDAASEITATLFLRVPIMVMLGLVVRTAVAQNEERRRLLETLAAAERRAGVLEERQRLSHEIHDTLAQGFAGILVHLARADLEVGRSADPMRPHLAFAHSVARENLEEARRMMHALRPQRLDEAGGLPVVLARVGAEWAERTGVPCGLQVTGTVLPLHADLEVLLLRATQELLTNVDKHARATRASITLSYMSDLVALDVFDDGVGFGDAAPTSGLGLCGLRERTLQFHGTLNVESAPGEGATATLTVPAFDAMPDGVPGARVAS
jgi:signal transduction histidine kinase